MLSLSCILLQSDIKQMLYKIKKKIKKDMQISNLVRMTRVCSKLKSLKLGQET